MLFVAKQPASWFDDDAVETLQDIKNIGAIRATAEKKKRKKTMK